CRGPRWRLPLDVLTHKPNAASASRMSRGAVDLAPIVALERVPDIRSHVLHRLAFVAQPIVRRDDPDLFPLIIVKQSVADRLLPTALRPVRAGRDRLCPGDRLCPVAAPAPGVLRGELFRAVGFHAVSK